MAKKTVSNANPVDEKFLLSLMAGPTRQSADTFKESASEESPSLSDMSEKEPQESQTTKKMVQSGRGKQADYVHRFLTPYRCENRQGVYIDRALHTRISMIIGVVGKRNLTVGNYIDNVLTHHFEQYGEDARSFCSKGFNQML